LTEGQVILVVTTQVRILTLLRGLTVVPLTMIGFLIV